MDALVKYWPILAFTVAIIIAAVKIGYQLKTVLDWFAKAAPTVEALSHVPEKLKELEKKVDRITPRVAEVRRLREDFDALDDDVGDMRDAMLRGVRPGPRTRRSRTPPSGVPILLPNEETKETDQ